MLDFAPRHAEAPLYGFFVFAGSPAQALLEHCHAGRQDEDGDRVGRRALDLTRALVSGVEADAAAAAAPLDLGLAGAVQVAVHLRPLQKRPRLDQRLELRTRNEVVLLTVRLVVSRLARGVRDAERQ